MWSSSQFENLNLSDTQCCVLTSDVNFAETFQHWPIISWPIRTCLPSMPSMPFDHCHFARWMDQIANESDLRFSIFPLLRFGWPTWKGAKKTWAFQSMPSNFLHGGFLEKQTGCCKWCCSWSLQKLLDFPVRIVESKNPLQLTDFP